LREFFRHPDELKRVKLSGTLEGKAVSVQGFGNVGAHVAQILHEEDGARIVAIGEWDGTVTDPGGLDVPNLLRHRKRTGSIRDFPGARTLDRPGDSLEIDCDILVPAALENQITLANVDRLSCKVVAEAANGPTTPGAEARLIDKGVTVLPDIYLNAGGVTVSYFEWTKNLSHMKFGRMEKRIDEATRTATIDATENLVGKSFPTSVKQALVRGVDEIDLVRSGLEETMIVAFNEVLETRNRFKGIHDLRTAAYLCAIDKIGTSYLELGIFP
jgi:glutamate dehydrogenase (NAD(P)+)